VPKPFGPREELNSITMAPKQVVFSEKGLKSNLLSQAIIHNGTIYVSGHIGLDTSTMQVVEGSVADRTRKALENIQVVLEEAGSSLQNILKVTCPRPWAHRSYSLFFFEDEHLHYEHGGLCRYEPGLCVVTASFTFQPAHRKQFSRLSQNQDLHGHVSL
jgi:hypothetical protein